MRFGSILCHAPQESAETERARAQFVQCSQALGDAKAATQAALRDKSALAAEAGELRHALDLRAQQLALLEGKMAQLHALYTEQVARIGDIEAQKVSDEFSTAVWQRRCPQSATLCCSSTGTCSACRRRPQR